MRCQRPYRQGVAEFRCGSCGPCLAARRRLWTSRLMLEYFQHEVSHFVTLTYSEENLPCLSSGKGTVRVSDAQGFLKRLRASVVPRKVRYFIVGEYGDRTMRPHYHALMFGSCSCEEISKAWGLGHVYFGSVGVESVAYVVSYVVKSLRRKDDPRLEGREPEFARMSLKPGIGFGAVEELGRAVTTRGGAAYVAREGDVPCFVRLDGQKWPIGRYLRSRLREEVGMDSGQPLAAAERMGVEAQESVKALGGVVALESLRVQDGFRHKRLLEISNSKRKGRL